MDCEFIHLYEAQIPSELLRMLENPTIATRCTDGSTITQRKIPFKPFKTFNERILAELLAPDPHDASDIKYGVGVVKEDEKEGVKMPES